MILAHLPAYPPALQVQVPLHSTLQAAAPVSAPAAQDVLAEINQARSNPSAYADWLETLRPYYTENVLSLPGEDRIRTQSGTSPGQRHRLPAPTPTAPRPDSFPRYVSRCPGSRQRSR
jgi:hypothetical protein